MLNVEPNQLAATDFTRKMRKATRGVHGVSDAMVQAKLSVASSADQVWADGLLVFYEIFRHLEETAARHPNSNISDIYFKGMKRTEAFENDLDFYLPYGWRQNYKRRKCVAEYILHLEHLEEEDPNLLLPYIYHLYMGLLSGGQILRKKRELISKFYSSKKHGGYAITEYSNKKSVYELKRELKARMNIIAVVLNTETQEKLIDESKTCFALNNELIRSVKGANQVMVQKFIWVMLMLVIVYLIYNLLGKLFY